MSEVECTAACEAMPECTVCRRMDRRGPLAARAAAEIARFEEENRPTHDPAPEGV